MESAIAFLWVTLVAILAVKRLPWAVLALLAALPIFLVRLSIAGVPTTPLELGVYVVAIVWGIQKIREWHIVGMVRQLFDHAQNDVPRQARDDNDVMVSLSNHGTILSSLLLRTTLPRSLLIPLLLWLGMTVASSIYAPDDRVGLGILKAWFVDPLLFAVIILDLHRRNLLRLSHVVWALGIGASVVALFGILDLFTFIGKIKIPGRLDSFYESANYVSLYLGPIFMIWLAMLFGTWQKHNWKMRAASAVVAAVLAIALLFTKSFGGWIATAAGTGLLLLLAPRERKTRLVGMLGIVLIAGALGWYGATKGFQHYNTLFKISSLDTRQDLWRGARGLIEEKPVFGHGIGGFRTNFPPYVRSHKELFPHYVDFYNALWPHNVYLAIWAESGVIALFGFLWLLAELLVRGFRAFRAQPRWSTLAGILALSTIAVHGLVDTPYFKNDLSVLFWVAVLFILAAEKQSTHSRFSEAGLSDDRQAISNKVR